MSDETYKKNGDEPFGSNIPGIDNDGEPESPPDVPADREGKPDPVARSPLNQQSIKTKPDASKQPPSGENPPAVSDNVLSDVARVPYSPVAATVPRRPRRTTGDWEYEMSAHNVVVELKRVENDVRAALEGVDNKRKRRLGGTQRWYELQDDILSWWYSGRVPEESLRRLQELIVRRHYLFNRLRFLASTRPVMNS